MIDSGSAGICTLANWSDQFVLTDKEREQKCALSSITSPAGCRSSSPRPISP